MNVSQNEASFPFEFNALFGRTQQLLFFSSLVVSLHLFLTILALEIQHPQLTMIHNNEDDASYSFHESSSQQQRNLLTNKI